LYHLPTAGWKTSKINRNYKLKQGKLYKELLGEAIAEYLKNNVAG
jgi:hypothetical protein